MSRAALKKASELTPADVVLHLGRRLEVRSVEPTHKDGLRVRLRGHEPIQVRWDAEVWVEAPDFDRTRFLNEALEAVRAERLEEPQLGTDDEAYARAVADCEAAILELLGPDARCRCGGTLSLKGQTECAECVDRKLAARAGGDES